MASCAELGAALQELLQAGRLTEASLLRPGFQRQCGGDMALRGIGGLSIIPPKLRQLNRGVTVGQTADRQISKSIAHNLKAGGGASVGTGTRESLVGDLGGIAGEHFGGETGSQIGRTIGEFIGDIFGGGGGGDDRPSVGNQQGQQLQVPSGGGTSCRNGMIKVGSKCVDPTAVLPGGDPFVTTAGGATVMGGFGLPAMQPVVETRVHRTCGPGMVLGKDNLCYPKQVLGRRSRFRKWRAAPKPAVSAADMKAIRRAARAKDRVAKLGKDVGLSVSKTPKRKSRKDIENEIRLQILDHG